MPDRPKDPLVATQGHPNRTPESELKLWSTKSPEELSALKQAGVRAARELTEFLDRSPTPFHAVAEVVSRLTLAGFSELSERDAWSLTPGARHYVVRGGTTIIAFVVGSESPATGGFRMIGAHTDSPCLRVKPNPDVLVKGYRELGVEIYGGVLLSTWLDRDLSIAGRVHCLGPNGVEARLVNLGRAVARVPNLAIHLNRGVNTDGLVLNPQRHMLPVVGLGGPGALRAAIGKALDVEPSAIVSHELLLYDTTKAAIAGLDDEFILSARLDNLTSCHAATSALVAATSPSPATRLIVLYDHEEVGSKSAVGAAGSVLRDTVGRIVDAHPDVQPQAKGRAMARSILISADMSHALHPNYEGANEPHHAPILNQGLVIKSNVNQSYATDGASAAFFERICIEVGFAPQRFVVRTDLPCGSTIGPITAAELGVSTVDVGAPMLSMHSCREMAGTVDVHLGIAAFTRALA